MYNPESNQWVVYGDPVEQERRFLGIPLKPKTVQQEMARVAANGAAGKLIIAPLAGAYQLFTNSMRDGNMPEANTLHPSVGVWDFEMYEQLRIPAEPLTEDDSVRQDFLEFRSMNYNLSLEEARREFALWSMNDVDFTIETENYTLEFDTLEEIVKSTLFRHKAPKIRQILLRQPRTDPPIERLNQPELVQVVDNAVLKCEREIDIVDDAVRTGIAEVDPLLREPITRIKANTTLSLAALRGIMTELYLEHLRAQRRPAITQEAINRIKIQARIEALYPGKRIGQ